MDETDIRILLVDDHPVVRLGIRRYLDAQAGLRVVAEVESGEQAIASYRHCAPDVVLMDIHMKGMSGIEATRVLCCLHARPAVIVISASDGDGDILRAKQAGARAFVSKDEAPSRLVDCIRAVAAGKDVWSTAGASPPLSKRETQLLALLARGYSNCEIARSTNLRLGTVNVYMSRLLARLSVRTRSHAVAEGLRRGLIPEVPHFRGDSA